MDAAQAVPKSGWLDVRVPIGIGYNKDEVDPTITTLLITCSESCADGGDASDGWDKDRVGAIFNKDVGQVIKINNSYRTSNLRIENAFAYKLTSDMATIMTDGLILKDLNINF